MTYLHDPNDLDSTTEPLNEGGTWLLDLVAAVDHLRRGHRPGLTVWDALAEALRWSHPDLLHGDTHPGRDHPDPLGAVLHAFLAVTPLGETPAAMQRAVRIWALSMGAHFNASHHWPHPSPRRRFPPALHTVSPDDDHLPPDAA